MKKLSFILFLISVLFLSCSLEPEQNEYQVFIRLSSTNETCLYNCYKTIVDAKKCNKDWIYNIDSWQQYATENPLLDSSVKNTMISEHFEVAATDFPDEHCYAVYIYISKWKILYSCSLLLLNKKLWYLSQSFYFNFYYISDL